MFSQTASFQLFFLSSLRICNSVFKNCFSIYVKVQIGPFCTFNTGIFTVWKPQNAVIWQYCSTLNFKPLILTHYYIFTNCFTLVVFLLVLLAQLVLECTANYYYLFIYFCAHAQAGHAWFCVCSLSHLPLF